MSEYHQGSKIVFIDNETYPQIWEILYPLRNGWYRVASNGPYVELEMPAHRDEIRQALDEEINLNKRI